MPLSAAPAAPISDRWRLRSLDRWLRLAIVLVLLPAAVHAPTVLSQVGPGASLTVVQGAVAVTQADGTKIYPAGTGLTLSIGDVVGTLERTRAIVTFFSGSEIELGSNTTIVIRRLDRDLLDQANVTVEHLSGMTVIRIPTDAGPNTGVRVLGNDTVAIIRNGEVGHGVDPITNNVTVACVNSNEIRCSRDGTTFPDPQTVLQGQTALTVTGDRDLIGFRTAPSTSIWDVLAEGAALRREDGPRRRPASERERNEKKDRDNEKEEDVNKPNQPQQPLVGSYTTPTRTPPPTFTPTTTATPSPTVTPTATSTPRTGAACGTPQMQVGGSGTFLFSHDLGKTSGTVHLDWNAFAEPDQFEILYQEVVLFSTFDPVDRDPFVEGTGATDTPFGPGSSTTIVIRVTTGENSVVWQYQVSCPP